MKKRIGELIRQGIEKSNPIVLEPIARIVNPPVLPSRLSPPPTIRFLVPPMGKEEADKCTADVREGRVYTIDNISRMLRCHKETVRRMFAVEPGVVRFGKIYRIPETVLERVLKRMMRPEMRPNHRP